MGQHSRKLLAKYVAVSSVAAGTVLPSGPVAAHTVPAPTWWWADNSQHTYAFVDLTTVGREIAQYGLTNLDNQTDMSVLAVPVNGNTDAVFYDQRYTSREWVGVAGRTSCTETSGVSSANQCQRFEIRLNETFFMPMTTLHRKQLGRHEVGHSVGLPHNSWASESCMINSSASYIGYSNHEVTEHLNVLY